jgi:hypothetical protein
VLSPTGNTCDVSPSAVFDCCGWVRVLGCPAATCRLVWTLPALPSPYECARRVGAPYPWQACPRVALLRVVHVTRLSACHKRCAAAEECRTVPLSVRRRALGDRVDTCASRASCAQNLSALSDLPYRTSPTPPIHPHTHTARTHNAHTHPTAPTPLAIAPPSHPPTRPPTLTRPPCHRALVHTRIASPITAPATPCQRVDDYQSESFARQPRHHVSYDDNSRSTASREVAVTRNIRKVADIGGVCHARLLKIAYPPHRRI